MENWWIYTPIFILIVLLILWKMKRMADAVNDYFCDACRVYCVRGDETAKLAAITAGKTAATVQRQSMIDFAKGMISDFEAEDAEVDVLCERLNEIQFEISIKDWSIDDIVLSKKQLGLADRDMLKALERSDGNFFKREYSDLFN